MTATNGKVPQMRDGYPQWCHKAASWMPLQVSVAKERKVILSSGAAKLTIEIDPTSHGGPDEVVVEWTIYYNIHGDQRMHGRRLFSGRELLMAFGAQNPWIHEQAEEIIDQYGGDRCLPGYYIGYEQWLNIPGPGTGHEGDPNLSIMLNDQIKDAVKALKF